MTYIGSTTQPLYKRLNEHRNQKASFERGDKSKSCSSAELLSFDDCCITLIEDFPCERKEQLLARERYYYDQIPCVNKQRPFVTPEEKKLDNWQNLSIEEKMKHNEDNRKSYHKNIENERERSRDKYKRTIETRKAYYEKNKEKNSAWQKQRVICSCGIETSINNKIVRRFECPWLDL